MKNRRMYNRSIKNRKMKNIKMQNRRKRDRMIAGQEDSVADPDPKGSAF